ncbi:endoglucanase [Streptomyces sp. NPDC001985]|uniref:endoglucanase n=1 Tax=Streptomyces sp. NPDC001985 TaxID=3154406 RepID=UPI0033274E71
MSTLISRTLRGALRGRGAVAAALLLVAGLTAAGPARAAGAGEATGPTGQKLSADATKDLDPTGHRVTVTGSGYDPGQGVYLAVCVIGKAGEAPSPCLGGMDLSGASGSSIWISNNPPEYAKDLVRPFTVKDGKGGFTFDLTVKIKDSGADCTEKNCAIVTRSDHTDSSDRRQDVIIPITFGAMAPPRPEVPPGTVRHAEVRRIAPPSGGVQDAEVDPVARRVWVSSADTSAYWLTSYDTGTGAMVGEPVELPSHAGVMALDTASGTLHLGFSDRIATYDTRTGVLTDDRTPRVAQSVGHVAVDPGTGRLYVANQNRAEPAVTVWDTGKWKPVGEPARLAFPAFGLAVDTKRHIGYAVHVGNVRNPETGQFTFSNTLDGIDGSTGRLATTLSLGTTALGSQGVAVDPETGTGYVANIAAGSVLTVDLEANRVTGSVVVGGNPKSLAYDSGTGTLYAAQTTAGTVAVVDLARDRVVQVLETGKRPNALALDQRNHTLFTVAEGIGKIVQTQRQVSPGVTGEPAPVTVRAGQQAVLKAAGEGTPAPGASWEVSTDEGRSWQPIAWSIGTELSFRATVEHSGNRYRAVFSNPVGSTRTAGVELTVTPAPEPSPSGPDPGPGTGPEPSPEPSPSGTEAEPDPGSSAPETETETATETGAGRSGDPITSPAGTGGGPGAGDGTSAQGGGSLAATGTDLLRYGIAAAVLMALGTAAVILRRRAAPV